MRWRSGRRSRNIEDRRGQRVGGRPRLGLGRGRGAKGGGIGIIVIALIAMYFGVDPRIILQGGAPDMSTPAPQQTSSLSKAEENELADFISVVLADTEDTWHQLFAAEGQKYQEPRLVLFTGAVKSACGFAQSAMGPFYCPADQKVYIDLSFYHDLRERHNAPGDFAQAYVVAHEVGHHVQTLLGISRKVHAARQRLSKEEGNKLSVKQELQADCFSGLWAHHADRSRDILEQGDIEEALQAASQIGDDRLQKQGRGYVTPESFTHGTSAQRVRWFKRGLSSGNLSDCDTFSARSL